MRVWTTQPPRRASINMTPMIDVVFQLIVFFTATSTMARNEFSQAVELPEAQQGKRQEAKAESKRVTVNLLPGGQVIVAGRQVSPDQFRRMLAADLARYGPQRLQVQFRADRAATYGAVEPLLLICAQAGVWQVGFSVKTPERVPR